MGEPLVHTPAGSLLASAISQGVAFNAHYLNYFDTSMTELWRAAFGGYRAMLDRGVDMVARRGAAAVPPARRGSTTSWRWPWS